jgi:hypothetical protein
MRMIDGLILDTIAIRNISWAAERKAAKIDGGLKDRFHLVYFIANERYQAWLHVTPHWHHNERYQLDRYPKIGG